MTNNNTLVTSTSGLSAITPLRYTYLLKSKKDQYIYESKTGLWSDPIQENNLIPQQGHDQYQIIDCLESIKTQTQEISSFVEISIVSNDFQESFIQLYLSNQTTDLLQDQLIAYKSYNKYDFKQIEFDHLTKFKHLFNDDGLIDDFKTRLDELAKFCNVEIIITGEQQTFKYGNSTARIFPTHGQFLNIYVLGNSDDTVFAEARLRVLLDDETGLFIESVEIPLSVLPILGGVDFGNFKSIAKETNVNIYLPTMLPELFEDGGEMGHSLDTLFLSGSEIQVLLAKKQLVDMLRDISKGLYFKQISILKFKKDYIVTNCKNELSSIMYKYGIFVQLPPFGSDEAEIKFQGISSEIIELAIEDFITLTNSIYLGNIWFHSEEPDEQENYIPSQTNFSNEDAFRTEIQQISYLSQVSIYANKPTNAYEVIGTKDQILTCFENFQYSAAKFGNQVVNLSLKIELGLIHHEFISGKKNGKISKIMNNSRSTQVTFNKLNEYNLVIELKSGSFMDFFNSFNELQLEFPSEIKFHIPEAFHRQIIGTGGSIIQSIMRKYNVFVKFSNSYDLKSNFKNHVRFDNVIIRCPFKNSTNIPLVQNELNQLLINNEAKNYSNTFIKISINQYKLFDFNNIQEIEKKTSTYIRFPLTFEPYLKFKEVEIIGIDNNSITASNALIKQLAQSYEFKITWDSQFNTIFNDNNQDYLTKLKVPIKVLYNFEIFTVDNANKANHSIIISYHKTNECHLNQVIKDLTAFLRAYDLLIVDRIELSNNDLIINGSASNQLPQQNVFFNNIQYLQPTNQLYQLPAAANYNPSFQHQQKQQNNGGFVIPGNGSLKFGNPNGRPSTFNGV